jgi:spore germination protein GerM
MNQNSPGLAALIVLCILAGRALAFGGLETLCFAQEQGENRAERDKLRPTAEKVTTHIYFLDVDRLCLRAEERVMVQQESIAEQARSLVNALIEGPETELSPTLPVEARLRALYVTEDGVAYVDFDGTVGKNHPRGILTELFTVFSVVNTLALNLEAIDQVKILIEGNEAKTLAGHIDIRFPFRPNVLMIK